MTDLETFQRKHQRNLVLAMKDFLASHTNEQSLFEAMDYSLEAGGKRLRPMLILAIVESAGKNISTDDYAAAGALEMIHTYSLIHDDLPAMDNDDLRRGKPTNHKVYGEALAILAGDGLLTAAFEWVATTNLSAEKRVALLGEMAKAAGTQGMVAGQVADIAGEGQHLDLAALKNIHARKTGALLHYAVYAGCILAELSEVSTTKLLKFADHFGLAFQIRDDILDVVGDEAVLGNKVGVDADLGKNTYPALLTLTGARKALATELLSCEQILTEVSKSEPNFSTNLLQSFVDLLKEEDF